MTTTKKAKAVLSDDSKYNYSKVEKQLFALLSEKKHVTSIELATIHFGEHTLFGRNNIVSRMKLLAEKVRVNKEPFRIAMSEAQGPKPKEYWLERAA